MLEAVAELEKFGVRVRSLTEDFDTGTASGRLMLTMLSGLATNEREVILLITTRKNRNTVKHQSAVVGG